MLQKHEQNVQNKKYIEGHGNENAGSNQKFNPKESNNAKNVRCQILYDI